MMESNGRNMVNKVLVLSIKRLLLTIKRFPQSTNMIRMKDIIETKWLYVDHHGEMHFQHTIDKWDNIWRTQL